MYVDMNVSVEIDLDDLFDEMSTREKGYMAELLKDEINSIESGDFTIAESEFRENIDKLKSSFYQLSNEQIDIINQIIKAI